MAALSMKKNELEFFPFFVDKFLSATSSWTSQRVGAYMLLLLHQWKRGHVPGDDIDEIAIIMREPLETATALWQKLAVKFPKGPAGYQNAKLEEVRLDVVRRIKGNKNKTKAATKAAAEARRHPSRTHDCDRDISATDNVTNTVTDASTDPKSEILKSGNGIPPQPARRAGLVELSTDCRAVIEQVLRNLTVGDCATAQRFHQVIVDRLQAIGWTVTREVRVSDRGDGRAGYVDVVVTAPQRIAIELDRNLPRAKSIEKVLTLSESGYAPVVLCRAAPVAGWWTDRRGVEVWGLGEEPTPMYSTRRSH